MICEVHEARMKGKINAILVRKPEGKGFLGNLGVDVMIIL
jgi:hypothetical protein